MHPNDRNPVARGETAAPVLSVVVVILWSRDALRRCLAALAGQRGVVPEIIVPHDDGLQAVAALEGEFPGVRFVAVPGRRTFAELRSRGFREARGQVVAVTEDHCIPDADWCANIVRLHQGPSAAVGGAVDKSEDDTALNWAVYLCDFSRYMNPVPEGPSGYLTDCNVSYKRRALEATADLWGREFHETTVNWTLLARGETLWLSPDVVVRQQRSLRWGPALAERYGFGRLFAMTRVAGVPLVKRLAYAGFTVALPVLRLSRVFSNVLGKRRNIGRSLRVLPHMIVLELGWAAGECVGYLTGRSAASLRPGVAPTPEAPGAGDRSTA